MPSPTADVDPVADDPVPVGNACVGRLDWKLVLGKSRPRNSVHLVADQLASSCDKRNETSIGTKRLADETGLSRSTVQEALKDLHERGFLAQAPVNLGGRHKTSIYRLTCPAHLLTPRMKQPATPSSAPGGKPATGRGRADRSATARPDRPVSGGKPTDSARETDRPERARTGNNNQEYPPYPPTGAAQAKLEPELRDAQVGPVYSPWQTEALIRGGLERIRLSPTERLHLDKLLPDLVLGADGRTLYVRTAETPWLLNHVADQLRAAGFLISSRPHKVDPQPLSKAADLEDAA